MTLRTTSSPFARLTLTELRNHIADGWIGETWANLATQHQSDINFYLDGCYDYVSRRLGNAMWARREKDITLVSGTATYSMPADFRQMIEVNQTVSSKRRRVLYIEKDEYWRRYNNADKHPLQSGTQPYWYADGMDSSDPPVVQIVVVPTPAAAGTLHCYYIPFLGKLANDSFVELLPSATQMVIDSVVVRMAAQNREWNTVNQMRALREEEFSALTEDARPTHEPIQIAIPQSFVDEIAE